MECKSCQPILHPLLTAITSSPHPILDRYRRLLVLLAGRPVDIDWDAVIAELDRVMEDARRRLKLSAKNLEHRRGNYATIGMGISFGGGQQMPANLDNTEGNKEILEEVRANWAVKRVTGFINRAFACSLFGEILLTI